MVSRFWALWPCLVRVSGVRCCPASVRVFLRRTGVWFPDDSGVARHCPGRCWSWSFCPGAGLGRGLLAIGFGISTGVCQGQREVPSRGPGAATRLGRLSLPLGHVRSRRFLFRARGRFQPFSQRGWSRRRVNPGNSCSSASEREAGHVSYRPRPRKPGNPALHSWSYRRTRSSPAVRGVWIVAGLAFPDPPGELWEVRKSSSLDCPASTRTDAPTLSLPQSGTRPS